MRLCRVPSVRDHDAARRQRGGGGRPGHLGAGVCIGVPSAPRPGLDERERAREVPALRLGARPRWSVELRRCSCSPCRSAPSFKTNGSLLASSQTWFAPARCVLQPRACVPSVQLAQPTSSQSHTPSQSHTLQPLLQRSTLRDGRVGVGALGKTCAAAGRRGGQAGGLAERGVRRGVLCLLVLRAASTRMVPPTRARRTCAHVAVSRVCGAVVSGGV